MGTSLNSSCGGRRSRRLAGSYLECACLLMLGSLAVLSKPAVAGTPSYPGPGASPPALAAPPVKTVDPVGVPPGVGPKPIIEQPTPPKVVLPPTPLPAPQPAPLPPPKSIALPAPTPDGGVTPGAGPSGGPKTVSAPLPAPLPNLESVQTLTTIAPPPKLVTPPAIEIDHSKTATQGAGANASYVTSPGAQANNNLTVTTPASPGAVASLSPNNAAFSADIAEILPSARQLVESMREAPAVQMQAAEKDIKKIVANNPCIAVSFRPDSQRQGLSLVDLTGDGLIISAVPNTHIQSVFASAGYGQVDLSQAARWCITQTAVRALVRTSQDVSAQQAALLVQTGNSMQLMSKDQWLSYQASMAPVVTAMEPVIPAAVSPEVSAKPTKPSRPTKPSKPANRTVSETRKPAYL